MIVDDKIKLKTIAHGFDFSLVREETDGVMFRRGLLTVIISDSVENDNKMWRHLSIARPNKYPAYDEIKRIKNIFLGDVKAIMIFPKDKNFVNIHPYCFHLWSCLNGDVIPDFDRGIGTI